MFAEAAGALDSRERRAKGTPLGFDAVREQKGLLGGSRAQGASESLAGVFTGPQSCAVSAARSGGEARAARLPAGGGPKYESCECCSGQGRGSS